MSSQNADDKSQRNFRGVGELERTGYIPEGSSAERETPQNSGQSVNKAVRRFSLSVGVYENIIESVDPRGRWVRYDDIAKEREELRTMLREASCPMCEPDDPPRCPWCAKRAALLGDSK